MVNAVPSVSSAASSIRIAPKSSGSAKMAEKKEGVMIPILGVSHDLWLIGASLPDPNASVE